MCLPSSCRQLRELLAGAHPLSTTLESNELRLRNLAPLGFGFDHNKSRRQTSATKTSSSFLSVYWFKGQPSP